jgi:arylsulfatase
LAALDDTGQSERTVVIFLSDNGGCASVPLPEEWAQYEADNRGISVGNEEGYEFLGPGWGWAVNAPFRRFKTWTYEGGICTPMIVRWPGMVPPGTISHAPGHVIDLMPTLIELTAGEYPKQIGDFPTPSIEGESLVPSFKGVSQTRATPLFFELYGNRAVRDGRWKLVWGASQRRWELYDLATDRSETRDLAAVHPERVKALAIAWTEWAQRTGNVRGRAPGT